MIAIHIFITPLVSKAMSSLPLLGSSLHRQIFRPTSDRIPSKTGLDALYHSHIGIKLNSVTCSCTTTVLFASLNMLHAIRFQTKHNNNYYISKSEHQVKNKKRFWSPRLVEINVSYPKNVICTECYHFLVVKPSFSLFLELVSVLRVLKCGHPSKSLFPLTESLESMNFGDAKFSADKHNVLALLSCLVIISHKVRKRRSCAENPVHEK